MGRKGCGKHFMFLGGTKLLISLLGFSVLYTLNITNSSKGGSQICGIKSTNLTQRNCLRTKGEKFHNSNCVGGNFGLVDVVFNCFYAVCFISPLSDDIDITD